MAVQSKPASKSMASGKKDRGKEANKRKQVDDGDGHQSKRTKCPGVRVVGGRIYDSENGKTCHQVTILFFFFFFRVPICVFCLADRKVVGKWW